MHSLLCLLLTMLAPFAFAQAILNSSAELDTPTGTLHSSLMLPKSEQRLPVALLIAGSGPTDHNGNDPQMRNDSLKRLAQVLARSGIASLRYDKRGIAAIQAAGPDERALSVERYAEDAIAWNWQLKADPRFGQLILIGHSKGALIASLAVQEGRSCHWPTCWVTASSSSSSARLPTMIAKAADKKLDIVKFTTVDRKRSDADRNSALK